MDFSTLLASGFIMKITVRYAAFNVTRAAAAQRDSTPFAFEIGQSVTHARFFSFMESKVRLLMPVFCPYRPESVSSMCVFSMPVSTWDRWG
jgi:hypothetical protein